MDGLTYSPGRIFLFRLSPGQDLLARVSECCTAAGAGPALFTAAGSLSRAVIGVFDTRQRVYVTETFDGPFELVSLSGAYAPEGSLADVSAHAVLVDLSGRTTGGRVFEGTLADHGELRVRELAGGVPLPAYDLRAGVFDPTKTPENRTP